jgi:hypothetical protein
MRGTLPSWCSRYKGSFRLKLSLQQHPVWPLRPRYCEGMPAVEFRGEVELAPHARVAFHTDFSA